jgi:hypothetical protein
MTDRHPFSYTTNEKLALRKRIHAAGHAFFESLSDIKDLQNIAGEFMALNEDWCLLNPDTVGFQSIMRTGFSDNQKHFIERLAKKLREQPL